MKRILAVLFSLLLFASPAVGAKGAGSKSKPIMVYVIVPSQYTSTVTSAQAISAVQAWLGSPSDAPCVGSTACTIEGWFRHELGAVFDYQIVVLQATWATNDLDACGQGIGPGASFAIPGTIELAGYPTRNTRYIALVLGAGGWAGHVFDPKGNVDKYAIVGDWGVMERENALVPCIPDWDYPNRGFSHEFAGMLGMYATDGYSAAAYVGDTMSTNNKVDLLRYSGGWLRDP